MTSDIQLKWCVCADHEGPNPLSVSEFGKDRSSRDGLSSRCKPCLNLAARRYRAANPEKVRRAFLNWTQKLRDQVLDRYGRVCACPGCGAAEDLSIDHVNGGGNAHRIELFGRITESARFYAWLIENGFPDGFQVLCRPCNSSKADGPACRLDHFGTGLRYCSCPEHAGPNPLPLSEFNKHRSYPGGLEYFCRACTTRRLSAWRAKRVQEPDRTTKGEIVRAELQRSPGRSSREIADLAGCTPAYVRMIRRADAQDQETSA